MEYVLTEAGNIKITDGKPTVKGADGKEFGIDAIGAQDKINNITTESNERRKKLGEATKQLEAFAGIEDPAAAIQALQTVSSLTDDHKLEIEKLKATMNTTWQEKLEAKEGELSNLSGELFKERVGNKFATSEIIKQTTLPPDVAALYFGKHFSSDGTATDSAGNVIYSKENPGEPAGFEESMAQILNAYPHKDSIMRGSGAGGSGAHKTGDGDSQITPIPRESFEKMEPAAQSKHVLAGGKVT